MKIQLTLILLLSTFTSIHTTTSLREKLQADLQNIKKILDPISTEQFNQMSKKEQEKLNDLGHQAVFLSFFNACINECTKYQSDLSEDDTDRYCYVSALQQFKQHLQK